MSDRCSRGSVRIGKRLALRVLDWHGGMSFPSYAVGSIGFVGKCVSKDLVRQAIVEFNEVLASPGKLVARVELRKLVAALKKKAG